MTLSAQWIRHSKGLAHNGGQLINSVKYSIKCRSLNKREHGGEAQRGVHMKLRSDLLCFLFCFFFPVIYHRSGLHNRILPTMFFSPVEILLPEYQRLGSAFFHPPFPLSFQPLISPSYPPPPTAASFLSYPIFCRLPGFIPQQWGWKLHFSWNVSCCKAPAGVIFFFFFFFLQRWKTSGCICRTSCM